MDFNARWLPDTDAENLEPDEMYTLAKTEYQALVRFVIQVEEKLLINERYWEMTEEGSFSDWPALKRCGTERPTGPFYAQIWKKN